MIHLLSTLHLDQLSLVPLNIYQINLPINTISPTVGEAGDESVSVTSENAPHQRKERQNTSKVWKDFSSVTIRGVKKSQCNWCKRLFAVEKSSTTLTLNMHLTSCVKICGV
jgi:hypothetical protein